MGMWHRDSVALWHVTQKVILLLGLSLKGIIQHGGGQGGPRPQSSWLGQVDASCWELLGIGRAL